LLGFNEVKRQKYINEDYCLKSRADCMEAIASYAEMLVEYNCGGGSSLELNS